ncbi:MAG: hypothetical protein ABR517_13750 [Thermoanaerobaculia bacterium]
MQNPNEPVERIVIEEERPPVGGTWRRLYTIVLLTLVADVVIFWIFTKVFS